MGANFGSELEKVARNASGAGMDRARAIYEMQRHGAAPSAALLTALVKDGERRRPRRRHLRRRRAGRGGEGGRRGRASRTGIAAVCAVARPKRSCAWASRRTSRASLPVADIYALLNDPDRFVRWAGRIAIEHTPRAEWKDRVLAETNPLGAIEGMLAWVRTAGGESLQPVIDKQFAHAQADEPLGREQAAALPDVHVHDHRGEGRTARRPARAAERGDHRPVPGAAGRCDASTASSRSCSATPVSRPRSRRSSRRSPRPAPIRSCSSTICMRCG